MIVFGQTRERTTRGLMLSHGCCAFNVGVVVGKVLSLSRSVLHKQQWYKRQFLIDDWILLRAKKTPTNLVPCEFVDQQGERWTILNDYIGHKNTNEHSFDWRKIFMPTVVVARCWGYFVPSWPGRLSLMNEAMNFSTRRFCRRICSHVHALEINYSKGIQQVDQKHTSSSTGIYLLFILVGAHVRFISPFFFFYAWCQTNIQPRGLVETAHPHRVSHSKFKSGSHHMRSGLRIVLISHTGTSIVEF